MSNLSWVPPLWSDLDPTRDCGSYGQFAADIARNGLFNAPIALTVSYFRSILPPDFSPQPTQLQILEWYEAIVANYTDGSGGSEDLFTQAFAAAEGVCHDEFCTAVGFQGNADVTGIGVMVAYCIEACLVTLFCIALGLSQLRRHRHYRTNSHFDGTSRSPVYRIFDAFRGCVNSFWSAAAVLSLTILIISIRLTSKAVENMEANAASWMSGSAISAYDPELTTLASFFSFYPVIILALMVKNKGRRRWLKRAIILSLYVLLLVQLRLGVKNSEPAVSSSASRLALACNANRVRRLFLKFAEPVFYVLVAVPAGLAVISAAVAVIFKIKDPGMTKEELQPRGSPSAVRLPEWFRRTVKIAISIMCFGMMWASLSLLVFVRRRVINAAGNNDPSQEWGFGQMLALATWIPVFLEWFYILIVGLKGGLEGHVPHDYSVIFTPDSAASPHAHGTVNQSHHSLGMDQQVQGGHHVMRMK